MSDSAKPWLWLDERGTWEAEAQRLLDKCDDEPQVTRIREEKWTEAAVNEAVATRLAYMATVALLNDAMRR